MNISVVYNDASLLKLLKTVIKEKCTESIISEFEKSEEFMKNLSDAKCNYLFLDMDACRVFPGIVVFQKTKQILPDCKIIAISNQLDHEKIAPHGRIYLHNLIEKPLILEDLREILDEIC